jgi:UDP-N-acetylmuramate dehydrogenase
VNTQMSAIPGVQRSVSLAPLTSYKLGGRAEWFVEVNDNGHLDDVLHSLGPGVEMLVLGKGTNLLVADHGFPGLVVRLGGAFLDVTVRDDGSVVGGGAAPLPRVARTGAEAGRCGLEFYAGIPGTVGGAVMMNTGGHGSDTAERLISAVVVNRTTGARSTRTAADLALSYRHSNLGPDDLVTSARFSTSPCTRANAEARIREITRWRKQHQPGGTFNAGSVFKNPPGDAAGRLIDDAGLKGLRCGGVAVSEMHANFFTADEDAVAQDVWDLVWAVRRRVFESTGVCLTPEIRFVGAFEESGEEPMEPETAG